MAWISPQNLKLVRSYLREMAIVALAWIYLREKMLRESEQKEYNEHLINDAKDFREDVYRVGAMSQKLVTNEKDTVYIAYPAPTATKQQ